MREHAHPLDTRLPEMLTDLSVTCWPPAGVLGAAGAWMSTLAPGWGGSEGRCCCCCKVCPASGACWAKDEVTGNAAAMATAIRE